MVSLQSDFAEPDYKEIAKRWTEITSIPMTDSDAEFWYEVFAVLKPPPPGSDEIEG